MIIFNFNLYFVITIEIILSFQRQFSWKSFLILDNPSLNRKKLYFQAKRIYNQFNYKFTKKKKIKFYYYDSLKMKQIFRNFGTKIFARFKEAYIKRNFFLLLTIFENISKKFS